MKKKYFENQGDFCKNLGLFDDKLIENKIRKVRTYFNNISLDRFVYNSNYSVIKSIILYESPENTQTNNLISFFNYYSKIKKISMNEITILYIIFFCVFKN